TESRLRAELQLPGDFSRTVAHEKRSRGLFPRGLLAAPLHRLVTALPAFPNLRLGEARVIGRRRHRQRPPYLEHDDLSDRIRDTPRREERLHLVEERRHLIVPCTRLQDRCGTLEAIALASERIDDVDLNRRISAQVRNRLRRADIREDEVVIVPDGNGSLRRQVRRLVLAHRRDERQALLAPHALHVLGEEAHAALLSRRPTRDEMRRASPARRRSAARSTESIPTDPPNGPERAEHTSPGQRPGNRAPTPSPEP